MSDVLKLFVFMGFVSQVGCGRTQFSATNQGQTKSIANAASVAPLSCADLTDDEIIAEQVQRIQDVISQLSSGQLDDQERAAIENAERFKQALLTNTSVRHSVIAQERLFCEHGPLCPLAKPDEVVLIPCSENPLALDVIGTGVPK